MEMIEALKTTINHYGVLPQLKHMQGEVYELSEAIIIYENERPHLDDEADKDYIKMLKEHIKEEIADVMNMVEQFIYYYEIDVHELIEIKHYKMNRQLNRIENEVKELDVQQ